MKKYAKPIALVAILVVAIALIFVSVYFNSLEKDKEFTLGDFTVVSEGSGISIVSYNGDETTLTIPAKIEGKKVVSVAAKAFNSSSVTTLSFADDAIVELAESVFSGNSTIVSVKLPTNITNIPAYAFYNCSSLKYVTMPDSVTYIGKYAFYGCVELFEDIEESSDTYRWYSLPTSLTEICDYAFYGCDSLDALYVPTSLKVIGASAFRSSALQKFALFEDSDDDAEFGITTIDSYAFYGTYLYSKSTNELYFPNLTTIGEYAFASATQNFYYFRVAPSVETIGNYAFSGSTIQALVFEQDEDGEELSLGNNICYACTSLTSVTMNIDKITEIPDGMFMGCTKLLTTNNLILGENVTTIGKGAFSLYATSASTSSITQSKTILFDRTDADGNINQVAYNNYFRIVTLDDYYNSNEATCHHFAITDYDKTILYAYVGLYSDSSDCYYYYNSAKAYAFKFMLSSLRTVATIDDYAFAGAKFTKLCLPGSVTSIGEKFLYRATVSTIYFDGNSVSSSVEFAVDDNAFTDISSDVDEVLCYVAGTQYSTLLANSSLKAALDELGISIDISIELPS